MRSLLPLLLVATLPLALGCNLGGTSRNGLSSAAATSERAKETWSAPKFAGTEKRRTPRANAPEGVDRTLDRAHDVARGGRFDLAAELYEQVLDQQPANPAAHHGLAIIADRNEDYARAEEHYRAALRSRPTDADLLNDAGYSYLMQGRSKEAEALLARALDSDPRHDLATSNLGHLEARRGRYDEALVLFRRVGSESQAQSELARYTSRDGRPSDAATLAERGGPRPEAARDDFGTPSPNGLSEEDWANLPAEQVREMMNAARREAMTERRDRDRAIERARPADDWANEPGGQRLADVRPADVRPADSGRHPEPTRAPIEFAPPGGSPAGDLARGDVRYDDRDPRNTGWPDDPASPGNAGWPIETNRSAMAVADPRLGTAAQLPDANGGPAAPGRARGHEIVPIGFEQGVPPWPGEDAQPRSMGRSMPAATPLREEWAADVADSTATGSDVHRRAALLGLNAGHGMLLPLDAGDGPVIQPGTSPGEARSARHDAEAAPELGNRPSTPNRPGGSPNASRNLAPGLLPNIRPGPAAGPPTSPETWPESTTWPESAAIAPRDVQPIATTSPVPTDPGHYRAADGTLHGAARPAMPPSYDELTRARRADPSRGRHEISQRDADRAALERRREADRLAFQGGGAPHPGFDRGFGPPTVTPQPRTDPNERAIPLYDSGR